MEFVSSDYSLQGTGSKSSVTTINIVTPIKIKHERDLKFPRR
jgi:hypothetical protein